MTRRTFVPLEEQPTARPFTEAWPRKTPWPVFVGSRQEPRQYPFPPVEQIVDEDGPVTLRMYALMSVGLPVPPATKERARDLARDPAIREHLLRFEQQLLADYFPTHQLGGDLCRRCGHVTRALRSPRIGLDHAAYIWMCVSCQEEISGYASRLATRKHEQLYLVIDKLLRLDRSVQTGHPPVRVPDAWVKRVTGK